MTRPSRRGVTFVPAGLLGVGVLTVAQAAARAGGGAPAGVTWPDAAHLRADELTAQGE